jgi:hypothetical protein
MELPVYDRTTPHDLIDKHSQYNDIHLAAVVKWQQRPTTRQANVSTGVVGGY